MGRPNAITVDAAGRVYISDASAKRVLRVERDGSGLTPITRVGGGPDEVQRPSSLAMVGDSVLAVYDGGQRRVVLFDRESMAARGSIAIGGFGTSIRSWRKGLVVGALMVDSLTAYALLADSAAVPQRGGSVPRIYNREPADRAGLRYGGSGARRQYGGGRLRSVGHGVPPASAFNADRLGISDAACGLVAAKQQQQQQQQQRQQRPEHG